MYGIHEVYQFATVSHLDLSHVRRARKGGIIHRPKDESEFLTKKKTSEANIFKFFSKGEPILKFWGNAHQNIYRKFV